MLSKIMVSIILFTSLSAVATPTGEDVQMGEWEDGAKALWQCGKATGDIKVMFVTPQGTPYQAILSCPKYI